MAVEFKISGQSGLFKAGMTDFTSVTDTSAGAELWAHLPECKDPIFLILDLSQSAGASMKMTIISEEGKNAEISFSGTSVGVIPITTKGFKNSEGKIRLVIKNESFDITGPVPYKIGAVAYTPVVNR